ncbi:hypothetical protein BH09BAC3_BH09BAC3_13460 [soil metagenome]
MFEDFLPILWMVSTGGISRTALSNFQIRQFQIIFCNLIIYYVTFLMQKPLRKISSGWCLFPEVFSNFQISSFSNYLVSTKIPALYVYVFISTPP